MEGLGIIGILGDLWLQPLFASCSKEQSLLTSEPNIDVARFNEDYTVSCNIEKYNIMPYNFKDVKTITTKNIWVTKRFLENKEHFDVMTGLLENNCNILIQEYNFTAFDAYELFKIPNEKEL